MEIQDVGGAERKVNSFVFRSPNEFVEWLWRCLLFMSYDDGVVSLKI